MPSPNLRRADRPDLGFVAQLIVEGDKAGHFTGGHSEAERLTMLETILSRGYVAIAEAATLQPVVYEAALCIAELDGNRAGFLIEISAGGTMASGAFYSPFQVAAGVPANEIYMLSVAAEYQGCGLAGYLLDIFIESTRNKTVFARCRPASITMLGMLERRGFQRHGNIHEVSVLRLPPRP